VRQQDNDEITGNDEWVEVARADELPPGAVRGYTVAGRRIVLVRWEGKICALDARCPHDGGPLDQGEIYLGALVCPWHNFRYHPCTGVNVYPANVYPDDMPQLAGQIIAATTYPVRVEGDRIHVLLQKDS
jgi:nitrite reductase/ring-hydroxylating ferredoxin subunit